MVATGVSTVNSTITIQKKGETGQSFEADIYNYAENGIMRKVAFTKVIGGLVLPKYGTPDSLQVSFDFITGDIEVEKLFDTSNVEDYVGDWGIFDEYKITITFSNGSEYHGKIFYNAILKDYKPVMQNELLKSKLTFVLPLKNLNGDNNHYIVDNASELDTFDIDMGYD